MIVLDFGVTLSQYNSLNVKLSNSQLDKIKSEKDMVLK